MGPRRLVGVQFPLCPPILARKLLRWKRTLFWNKEYKRALSSPCQYTTRGIGPIAYWTIMMGQCAVDGGEDRGRKIDLGRTQGHVKTISTWRGSSYNDNNHSTKRVPFHIFFLPREGSQPFESLVQTRMAIGTMLHFTLANAPLQS